MFKSLIKKLEEENLPSNGSTIRDSIRDAGQAVMRQVKDKIEAAASGSSSTAGSAASSRTPSLIDFATDHLPATSPQPDQHLLSELSITKRERDGLLLRNSQLNNLISQMKAELSEERNLRRKLEDEYKHPNNEIVVNIMLERGSQTDAPPDIVVTPADVEQAAEDRVERDSLMLRNAELSNSIEKLKREVSEDMAERKEIEEELQHLKSQLLQKETQLMQELAERQQRQKQQPDQEVVSLKEHQDVVQKLEETISDKNKTIKLQLQRITDIKKSIQRGDVPPGTSSCPSNHNNNASSSFHPASASGYFSDNESSRTVSPAFRRESHSPPATLDIASHTSIPGSEPNDHVATTLHVNFEYLRNVVFKFITSSEYESQKQLVKAIATLLQFTEQEEHSVRETLEWRASWYSSLPLVGPNLKPAASAPSLKSAPPASTHHRMDHHRSADPRSS